MIQQISDSNFIDATLETNMNKYKSNIEYLIQQAKENGYVDKFVLIRNDEIFPTDLTWKLNCPNTYFEYEKIHIIKKIIEETPNKGFLSFFKKSTIEKTEIIELNKFKNGMFRSTKHFTVNTPLELTGEYNLVKSDRTFTIIDNINNFLNSGYAYSLSERDAYLDVSHEEFKISNNAIILISKEKYEEIKKDTELMKQITSRNLIVYKGDLTLAINMILSEKGILPMRSNIFKYDNELKSIFENSLKDICEKYNIEYNRPHGLGGGHFSSMIDQYANYLIDKDFIDFMNSNNPNNNINYYSKINWSDYANKIGVDNFISLVNKYSELKLNEFISKKEKYERERQNITEEQSSLFKQTIQLLKEYENNLPMNNEDNPLIKSILTFYISSSLEEQVSAALKIQEMLKNYNEENKRSI